MTYFHTNRKEDCCGCRACENICPKSAIDMVPDEEGFFFPVKNYNCINCGLCEKVCPYNIINIKKEENYQQSIKQEYPIAFATYGKTERVGCSSGGIFYVLAKYVIGKNGTVYGAAFDEKLKLRHVAADTIEELQLLRGSKYLQSNIGLTFREIKKKLKSGKYVMFTGTPCQVAGLKSFLNKDYDNLVTADLICHGVPSQWMFDQHVKYLENKNHAKLTGYHFRNELGWGVCEIADFETPVSNKKFKIKSPTYELSPYLYSFMYAFDYRLSCYECPFAKVPRQGDITLGDYWGIENIFPKMDVSKGISAILVNTPKGTFFWNEIKNNLVWKHTKVADISKNNFNLICHSKKPEIRENIYNTIKERGYADVAKKEFRSPRHNSIKIKLLFKESILMKPIVKLYKYKKNKQ